MIIHSTLYNSQVEWLLQFKTNGLKTTVKR